METKGNTHFRKIIFLEFFKKTYWKSFWNFRFLVFSTSITKRTLFLAIFMVSVGLLLASNVQCWIRDVQKYSSLKQFWPDLSKLKSAGSALNIAENAKISESALKVTEYLWELNPGRYYPIVHCSQLSIMDPVFGRSNNIIHRRIIRIFLKYLHVHLLPVNWR